MEKSGLSVVIATLNRADKVKCALESIKWAQEIIILDGGSSDGTIEVCRRYTDRIIRQPGNISLKNGDNIDLVKNSGFKEALSGWILSLDSDEVVPPGLAQEIRTAISSAGDIDGYFIPRKNYYWGKYVRCLQPDYQLRLFKKGKGGFYGDHIHEKIKVAGTAAYLKESLIHNSYDSVGDFIRRSFVYLPNEINFLYERGEKRSPFKLLFGPFRKFLYYYVRQRSFKDGLDGFILSWMYSLYYFVPYLCFFIKKRAAHD